MIHVTLLIFCVPRSFLPLAHLFETNFPGEMIMPGWQVFEANYYTMGRELPVPSILGGWDVLMLDMVWDTPLLSPVSLSFSRSRERLTFQAPSIPATLLL